MAFIRFNRPYKNHMAMVVTPAKAKEIEAFLNNPPDDLTDDQSDFLLAIHKIYHGKGETPPEGLKTPDSSHMYHEGIAQSMNDALPVNDR